MDKWPEPSIPAHYAGVLSVRLASMSWCPYQMSESTQDRQKDLSSKLELLLLST
jgi:hypothetical protein